MSNIDKLTLSELREAHALIEASALKHLQAAAPSIGIGSAVVGLYCIARCYAAGVHAGTVVSVDDDKVVLSNSRRLWNWKAADGVALSGLAQNGPANVAVKTDTMNPLIYLTGVAELIPCGAGVKEKIDAAK
jgi:hypothetical protein